jgi:hypothetical protein
VDGIRLDTFMEKTQLDKVDMLCIDLQGYELNAIKSMGNKLSNVKYIITECSIQSTYNDGTNFIELANYLETVGFTYVCSNCYCYNYPITEINGFNGEFDALFISTQGCK